MVLSKQIAYSIRKYCEEKKWTSYQRVFDIFIECLIGVLHDHVTAAMLDGTNNKISLHEIRDSIVLSSNMAAIT
jgi:hypothetical protein